MLHPSNVPHQEQNSIAASSDGPLDLVGAFREIVQMAPGYRPSWTVGQALAALGLSLDEAEGLAKHLLIERLRGRT